MTDRPGRIVSLVPSITELLFAIGVGDSLIGRTRFCEEPAGEVEPVEAVGGTKNPDCERIIALKPDLVVLNREENRIEDYDRLREAGLDLLVTHPRTVSGAVAMIEDTGARVGSEDAAAALAADCRAALEECERSRSGRPPLRVFCPIWRRPWMTFGPNTYVADVLRSVGMTGALDESARDPVGVAKHPDFFEVRLEDVVAAAPDLILLPDEPYAFGPEHIDELRAAGLVQPRYERIDGKDLSWYGPRIPQALARLRRLCV